MSTVVFYLLAALTAAKASGDLRTPPNEWLGELATMVVSLVVATVGAMALYLAGL